MQRRSGEQSSWAGSDWCSFGCQPTISCPSAGAYTATGGYTNGGDQMWVDDQANGTWGSAQEIPGLQTLDVGGYGQANALSCGSAGDCTVAGFYLPSPSTTSLTLSAPSVAYGNEQTEHLAVTVSAQYSGTPAGKITVKSGTATVCMITLTSGKGSRTLSSRQLPVGTHTLVAAYSGNADFTRSTSLKKTLTIVK